jgi:hypothetical protein
MPVANNPALMLSDVVTFTLACVKMLPYVLYNCVILCCGCKTA